MHSARAGSRRWRFAAFSTAAGLAVGASMLGAGSAEASSHREAPLIAGNPKMDNTDVYAFVAPNKTDSVTLIANFIPFEEPNGGPNFYPFQDGAHYDINIDNDGDAVADVTYRWTFTTIDDRGTNTFLYDNGPVTSLDDDNLLFKQTYTLQKIVDGDTAGATTIATGTAAPSDVGNASMPSYGKLRSESIATVDGGGKSYAGQADDPFFGDLRVFDLLYGANLKKTGTDTLRGYNVNSLALQVPKSEVAQSGDETKNPVIGIWSTTSMQTMTLGTGTATGSGAFVQVSRLGNPLVNEVVVPAGLKDAFNAISPATDHTVQAVVDKVTDPELPGLLKAIYGLPAPATPRNDLVEIYLTGIAKSAPTLDGTVAPIQADLNSQILNGDTDATKFVPSEMLRLNMGVAPTAKPNRLGVIGGDFQGFPNGRRLSDDVIDISIQAVEGAAQTGKIVAALATGDKVNNNDHLFGKVFPYLALPSTSSKGGPWKPTAAVAAPIGGGIGDDGGWTSHLGFSTDAFGVSTLALSMLLLGFGGLIGLRIRRSKDGANAGIITA
jgi:hypothetical protein